MTGWTRHAGPALALDQENIDTDQLIPARFMSTPRAEGYGRFLLHDHRHEGDAPNDHPLNRYTPELLVAGRNFGSGSSREAAVYALVDYGIRAVIAPSFGDIFAANAVNNGLCPARVAPDDGAALIAACRDAPADAEIDIAARSVRVGDVTVPFTLDDAWQEKLIRGWDDIAMTLQHRDAIAEFAARRRQTAPWVWT
jgi:3-isopropylmalate/(R)-2-methylmalate dehydratase small subunit